MTAPVLQIPVRFLRSAVAGRRPGDGNFRPLTDGDLFVNTQDKVACYLNAAGVPQTIPFDPAFFAGLAPLASPAITGTPTTTSPAAGDNSQQIAPTSWVRSFVNAILAAFAPLASPAFTGTPTSTTAPGATDSSTAVPNTSWVQALLSAVTNRGDAKQALSSAVKHLLRYNMSGAPYEAMARANIVVNPRLNIAQYGTSTTANGGYACDQWQLGVTGPAATLARITSAPFPARPDLVNALQVTVTTAKASLASGDLLAIYQQVEGQRVRHLLFGTAGAKPLALGFMCRSSVATTISVSLRNGAANRGYVQNVALPANTDTFVPLVFPGDTGGTWTSDSSVGLNLCITLASGSTVSTGAWSASGITGGTGVGNLAATASATFAVSDMIALPIGDANADVTTIFPSDRLPMFVRADEEDLRICQRYFEIAFAALYGQTTGASYYGTSMAYKVAKRASPAITFLQFLGSYTNMNSPPYGEAGGVNGCRAMCQVNQATAGNNYAYAAEFWIDARY